MRAGKNTLRAFDMFCGLGGSSRGAVAAGATVVGGIDSWHVATEAFSRNFPSAAVLSSRTQDEDPARVAAELGPVDLLLASPECTSHSCARGSRPRSEDSRNTAFEVLRYAGAMGPRWVVVENVVGMRRWRRYEEFVASLRLAGYRVAEQVLDAADFGVPQRRRRLFLLCDREEKPPSHIVKWPGHRRSARTILDPPGRWPHRLLDRPRRAEATLRRAARAVRELGAGEAFLIVYYGNDGAGGWQPLSAPLRTVTTLDRFGLCEPGPQGLTLRMLQPPELARAMGFGDELDLSFGTRRERIKLLGNGVCPPVMRAVVEALIGGAAERGDAVPDVGTLGSGDHGNSSTGGRMVA